jgi:hypothetical protein
MYSSEVKYEQQAFSTRTTKKKERTGIDQQGDIKNFQQRDGGLDIAFAGLWEQD